MPITREQKKKIIEDLKEKIARQKVIILVGISGLRVKAIWELRKRLKTTNAELKVIKKTLAEIVFKENKLDFQKKKFKEEIALVFGFGDEISPAKIAYQFALANPNLKILGGFLENKFREAEEIITIAQLPTKDELLAKLVGSISAPLSNFINVLEANIKGLIYILKQIKA